MSTKNTVILAALLAIAVGVDIIMFETYGTVFVLKKMMDLIEYLAFWR